MKKTLLTLVAILCFTFVAWTAGVIWPVLTAEQEAEVKQKLEAFEKGTLSYDDLTENAGNQGILALISFYQSHSNEVSLKARLPISRVLAYTHQYEEAAKLSSEYVQVYSNDWRGWRVLGGASTMLTNFDVAISAFDNAVQLGDDEESVLALASVAFQVRRFDVVSNLVGKLLVLKQSNPARLDSVLCLVMYSLSAHSRDIYLKALEGVSPAKIKSRSDLENATVTGLQEFEGEEIDRIRQSLNLSRAELEKIRQELGVPYLLGVGTNTQNSGKSP